jgi:enoyl-CoA hydratase/carnithine racemase
MTGDLVKAMRLCPQPIVAAIDGVCAGAGAILARASDLRVGTARSKTAFLFNRVGLAGCDMGACAMLPRIVGQGRASELLYSGRALGGEEAERWGFLNKLVAPEQLLDAANALAHDIAAGPTFANGITKTMLHQEWAMTIEQAIEAEAQAQAICMLTEDFTRAYEAFAAKQKPRFEGN